MKQNIKNNKGEKKARRERRNETNKEKMNEKKIGKSLNKNGTMCEGHLHISLGRAEVCAIVVCWFLLSLPAVALFLTSFCLGPLWGLLWRFAPPSMTPSFFFILLLFLPNLPSLKVSDGYKWNLLNKQVKQSMARTTCIIYICVCVRVWGWVQYTI